MAVLTLSIDGRAVTAEEGESILDAATSAGISIPTLCHLEGLSDVGACRLCMVEIAGVRRPQPACVARVTEGMQVLTNTEQLQAYRRMIVELLFAERNHVCSVCVANGHCELQDMAIAVGMTHVRYDYLFPNVGVDVTHLRYGLDQNRCILCTRCVRVCQEVEGAHTWDVAGRGVAAHLITDLNEPWGQATTCTSCGKCVVACPTGALFLQGSTVGEMERDASRIAALVAARGVRS